MALEKATIEILKGSRAGTRFTVNFNPNEYTIERSNAFKATSIPGLSGPLIHFIYSPHSEFFCDLLKKFCAGFDFFPL